MITLYCSCENEENNQSKTIFTMDVTSAEALVIKSSENGLRSSESTNKLYKLTQEGYLLEVTYKDESGNSIQSEQYTPIGVYNTPSEFVIVEYDHPHQYLIVNTRTGAVHVFWDNDGNCGGRSYLGPWGVGELQQDVPFEKDDAGNLYTIICSKCDGKGSLYRLNVSGMTLERLTPDIYNVTSFLIDGAGNVLFGSMFRLANGSFYNYESKIEACWNGQNRKIFALCEVKTGTVRDRIIVRFDIESNTVIPRKIENESFTTDIGTTETTAGLLYSALSIQSQRYKTGNYPYKEYAVTDYDIYLDATFCFRLSESGDNIPYDLANHKIEEIKTPVVPYPANSCHYSSRHDENLKLQLTAWSPIGFDKRYIYWTQPSSSDIRNVSLDIDGTAYISLFDYSSAMYVLYRVKPDGTTEELDSESYSSIVTLAALN
jgi:hypothetical protein